MKGPRVIDKGVIAYGEALAFQRELFARMQALRDAPAEGAEAKGYLVYCEHPHVYTLGRSGHESNLLVSGDFLKRIGASYYRTDRGGDITYHGYGQLVGYPILDLARYGLGLKDYIACLEEAVIRTVRGFGIEGFRIPGATGVWTADGGDGREAKLCAVGVKASRWVTMHGFALNVNTDLRYFGYIHPCGFTDRGVTSLRELRGGEPVDMERVKALFAGHFADLLEGMENRIKNRS